MALIDHFLPPLAFAAMLSSEETLADTPYETARADMEQLLDQAAAAAGDQESQPVTDALFAVCAFADEAVLGSAWPGRDQWMRQKLQEVRFNTANAGLAFYERMDRLCSDDAVSAGETVRSDAAASDVIPDRRREALEVYMACLTLGFQGKYSGAPGKETINRLTSGNLRRLLAGSGMSRDKVFPEAYTASLPERESPRLRPAVKISILFGVPFLLAAVIYLTYGVLLSTFVRQWLAGL